ncbi:hypothetical protein QTI66_35065 [Variovorax sp. J22R133]|uniref:hypothetical protein n=1 Tax=Variovorax brevis TaxID=3053503 RepID=UPI002576FF61|nr:hypothetical protein [Variovorax sp. J22R133]MDM0117340.1 hypothetical protein [Variovorax sp. J22R133]
MTLRLLLAAAIAATATQSGAAAPVQLVGYSGVFGEWEWTGIAQEKTTGRSREYAAPLTLVHVGVCTQDGPETKTGEIRFQLSRFPSEMKATISLDGVECTFNGRLSDRYTGSMTCPDRPAVPLSIWVK